MTNKDFIVKCISSASDGFTKDYIYENKNGRITYNNGDVEEVEVYNIEELNKKIFSQFELVDENKPKFKIGDKVRVREDRGRDWNYFGEMDKYFETIQEIGEVTPSKNYRLKDCGGWIFGKEDLTLVEETENNMFKKENLTKFSKNSPTS